MTAVCSVADVRNNKYTLPKDKLLDKKSIVAAFSISNFKGGKGMKQVVEVMKYVFASMGDAIGAVMGGFDGFLYALILFVVVDYLTGVLVAVYQKKLSSTIGFHGIAKKIVIFCLVAIAHVVDAKIIQNGSVVRTAVIFFYINNEGISVLENASVLGLPVPKKLKDVLEQIKDKEDD